MATAILPEVIERLTFQTPDGRVKIVRHGPKDFGLYLDGCYTKSYDYSFQAEHDGSVWLHEQAQQLAIQLSDEQAERDVLVEDVPIGIINGCPVYATRYDASGEDCHGQLYKWSLDWNGKTISVYDDDDVLSICPVGQTSCLDDIHLDDWQWLRALSQTDLVERLIALARGKGQPPPPAEPAIHVVPHICDDQYDPRYGTLNWLDYVCDTPAGRLELSVSDDTFPPWLYLDDRELGDLRSLAQCVPAIIALANHPDVRAALIRHTAGGPPKPTPSGIKSIICSAPEER